MQIYCAMSFMEFILRCNITISITSKDWTDSEIVPRLSIKCVNIVERDDFRPLSKLGITN